MAFAVNIARQGRMDVGGQVFEVYRSGEKPEQLLGEGGEGKKHRDCRDVPYIFQLCHRPTSIVTQADSMRICTTRSCWKKGSEDMLVRREAAITKRLGRFPMESTHD